MGALLSLRRGGRVEKSNRHGRVRRRGYFLRRCEEPKDVCNGVRTREWRESVLHAFLQRQVGWRRDEAARSRGYASHREHGRLWTLLCQQCLACEQRADGDVV